MSIKNINELEYIGESLTKINDNFSNLNTRVVATEADTSQYTTLENFYATHSNNSAILFKSGSLPLQYGNKTYTKSDVVTDTTTVDMSKIIYPATMHLNLVNTSPSVDVTYQFRIKETSSSSFVSFVDALKVSRAVDGTSNGESRSLLTFMDLGYYDWQILVQGSTAKSNLYYSMKYLT